MYQSLYAFRTPMLTEVMFGVTRLADWQLGTIIFVIALFFMLKRNKKYALTFALSVITSCILNYFVKLIFHVARPSLSPLEILPDYSFPSGHVMNNLVLYGGIAISSHKKNLVFAVTAWIILIGFSRIYLGSHYFTDVIGGALLGLTILYLFHTPHIGKLQSS